MQLRASAVPGRGSGPAEPVLFLCVRQQQTQQQQMYIAQVLQDPNSDEPGGASSEEDRGSSQDEDMLNGGSGINEADFQSGEDSLIANEVHQ